MLFADSLNNQRILPTKNTDAYCPLCKEKVVPHMGSVRVHHWAHRPKSTCEYGQGMTDWHYRWITRQSQSDQWEAEYTYQNYRFDCFNQNKKEVLEFQKKADYEYILSKTHFCTKNNLIIKWILHDGIFSSFVKEKDRLIPKTNRRLVLLNLLETLYMDIAKGRCFFYVDFGGTNSEGRSSRKLYQLAPEASKTLKITWGSYYKLGLIPY